MTLIDGEDLAVKDVVEMTGWSESKVKVQAFRAQEKYGYVWVALDDPLRPIPHFPEDGASGFRRIFQFYEEWKTSPLRMMENSFDNSHFSFVHKANFGMIDNPKPAPYAFKETDYGFEQG